MNSPGELQTSQSGFEGPEKNLQVIFCASASISLRSIQQAVWENMLDIAKCKILSCMSNDYCTSYILSESSLFVYDDRVILKTCGTTPLLLALDTILEIGGSVNMQPAAVLYWRKNFSHPENQPSPHSSFSTEYEFLEAHLGGYESSVIQSGPFDHDHWYFYYIELKDRSEFRPVFSLFEVKLHEVHPDRSKNFVWSSDDNDHDHDDKPSKELMSKIRNIVPGMEYDEFLFEPCGYSMNGLKGEEYETIHITPEDECSYVSFETTSETYINTRERAFRVIELFRPASFTAVEITDDPKPLRGLHVPGYRCVCPCSTSLMGGLFVTFWSYEVCNKEAHPLAKVAALRKEKLWENSIAEECKRRFPFGSEEVLAARTSLQNISMEF